MTNKKPKKITKNNNQKKKYVKTKKVTADKLAEMTQNGFIELEEKINRTEEKFDKKLKEHDKKFEEFDKKFDKLLIGQDKLIGLLEDKKIEEMSHDLLHKDIGDTLTNHENRLKKVEEKVIN